MKELNEIMLVNNEENARIFVGLEEFLKDRIKRNFDYNSFILDGGFIVLATILFNGKNYLFGLTSLKNIDDDVKKIKSMADEIHALPIDDSEESNEIRRKMCEKILKETDYLNSNRFGPIEVNGDFAKNNPVFKDINKVWLVDKVDLPLIKNEQGEVLTSKMVSLDEIRDNVRLDESNKKTQYEENNYVSTAIMQYLRIEENVILNNYKNEIECFINEFINATPDEEVKIFKFEFLKNTTNSDEKYGDSAALVYNNDGELFGIVSNSIQRWDHNVYWTIFEEKKASFEKVIAELIKKSKVEAYIEKILNENKDDLTQNINYISIDKFKEDPLSFIESQSRYRFNDNE